VIGQLEDESKSVAGISIVYVGLLDVSKINVYPNGSKIAVSILVISDIWSQAPLIATLILIANSLVTNPWFTAFKVK